MTSTDLPAPAAHKELTWVKKLIIFKSDFQSFQTLPITVEAQTCC